MYGPAGAGDGLGEVLFELRTIGAQVRVTAIDARTHTEVVIVAPRTASQTDMKRIARAKLARAVAQKSG